MSLFIHLDDQFSISLKFVSTSRGFKHIAKLFKGNMKEVSLYSVNYLNRTWEAFEFQSVSIECLKYFEDLIKEAQFLKIIEGRV